MKLPFSLLALTLLFTACQQGGKKTGTDSTTLQQESSTPKDHYLLLKGTIGGKPATMHLIRRDDVYDGWYYLDEAGEPFSLFYNPTNKKLYVVKPDDGKEPSAFTGTITTDGRYKGSFHTGDTTYTFDLKPDKSNAIDFSAYRFSDSATLFYNDPESPMALSTASIIWPISGTNDVIKQAIGKNITDPQQAAKAKVDSFLHHYKQLRSQVDTSEDPVELKRAWNWRSYISYNVVWNHFPLLVIEASNYEFTGGAHGNSGSHFTVIDLSENKILKPADVLKPGYQSKLSEMLERVCRRKFSIPDNDPLEEHMIVHSITPNDNFFITDKGVIFSYVPYEIGAWSQGQINLFIPFSEIRDIVNEAYLPKTL